LKETRGSGSRTTWAPQLTRNIAILDLVFLSFILIFVVSVRFTDIWFENLTSYEIRNILFSLLILISWNFFLWFTNSRDVKILGFGADEYKRIVNATFLSFTLIAIISYIFKLEISRSFILITYSLGLITLFVLRRVLRRRLLKARLENRYTSKVMLLQSTDADLVETRLNTAQHAGFRIIHRYLLKENKALNLHEIVEKAKENKCDQIIIGQSALINAAELRKLGWALEDTNIDLVVAPAVTEIAGPRLKVSNVEGLPLLHLEQPSFSGLARITKRILDLFVAILGLILISPILLVIALMVKASDRGPIIYRQKRIGKDNKEFFVYKFRTMVEGSHSLRSEVMSNTDKDPRLAKDPNDPRITKPGLFLRRWSIDEIPQLINVIKGEMSLVGPRPPLAEEVKIYESFENRRLLVKPGLTGLWQVSGRSELSWEDTVRLDLYYIENWSLTLDLLILLRTAAAVWRGEGAY